MRRLPQNRADRSAGLGSGLLDRFLLCKAEDGQDIRLGIDLLGLVRGGLLRLPRLPRRARGTRREE